MAKNKIPWFKIVLFLLVSSFALIIRIIPLEWTKKGDILVHYDWSKTIYQEGFKNIYFYPEWIYSPPTQPPLITYAFWLSRHIYENRYLLSELHNQIRIPPTAFILWFDKYGEFLLLRLWAILGDFACAFFVYYVVKKFTQSFKLAFLSFLSILFNPLTILETTLWGQNDVLSLVFVYLAFLCIKKSKTSIVSPLFFLTSILIKPTSLILSFFYVFYYFKNFKIYPQNFFRLFVSLIFCLSLIYFSFKPFLSTGSVGEIYQIITRRITSSSKGISRASNSAFNLYSLVFDLDKTPGSKKILGLSLDTYSLIFYSILNIISIKIFNSRKKSTLTLWLFLIFFISHGSFLLMTGMLERYFFPAFLASILLIFLIPKYLAWPLVLQNILWLLNMYYAYFQRESGVIKTFFEGKNNLMIRILSLLSIINFYLIYRYFRKYSATKSQY